MSTEPTANKPADSDLNQFLSGQQADESALQSLHTAEGHTGSQLMADMRERQRKKFWLVMVGVIVVILLVGAGIALSILTSEPPVP